MSKHNQAEEPPTTTISSGVSQRDLLAASTVLGTATVHLETGARDNQFGTFYETLTLTSAGQAALAAAGLTNKQIGERLFISGKTASAHVSAILRKLGAATRAEAAARARDIL